MCQNLYHFMILKKKIDDEEEEEEEENEKDFPVMNRVGVPSFFKCSNIHKLKHNLQ